MEEYTVITQGNAIYLEGKLGDEEQLDEVDRGMLVSNQIAGFLPLSVQLGQWKLPSAVQHYGSDTSGAGCKDPGKRDPADQLFPVAVQGGKRMR